VRPILRKLDRVVMFLEIKKTLFTFVT